MFLTITNLQKYYGQADNKQLVLNNISATVDEGNICVIMGPSGSGKSTLLHCIGGLERFDSGSICVDSVELSNLSDKKLAAYRRNALGFVFQFYNLIPNLTVAENVDVCKYLAPSPLDRDELLSFLVLEDKKNCFPNTLSGGEQQRCAIARALIKKPKLLLCDEPTGALDSKTSYEILSLIEKVNKEYGTTILIVTHNSAIKPMAHKIITIKDGAVSESYMNSERISACALENI
ncbi:MAG: ABC transporter ATP-binding protein [Clostridia bacterium]|nr:ABC transporter ATP-binding protein [Clostridia bacterium]